MGEYDRRLNLSAEYMLRKNSICYQVGNMGEIFFIHINGFMQLSTEN